MGVILDCIICRAYGEGYLYHELQLTCAMGQLMAERVEIGYLQHLLRYGACPHIMTPHALSTRMTSGHLWCS